METTLDPATQAAIQAAVKAEKDNEVRALKTANWALVAAIGVTFVGGIIRGAMGRRGAGAATTAQ